MGYLRYLWDQYVAPDDPVSGYTPYEFHPINMSMGRDFGRRESVQSIPGMDSVLDGFGRVPGPQDRRDMSFGFRVFTNGDNDAAYDLLAAQVAPGYPQRLVYQMDNRAAPLWFTMGSNPRIQMTESSAGNWGIGGYVDFVVTWRIRPDWRPRFSETAQVFHHGSVFVHASVFGSLGTTVVATNPQFFSVDATGTPGLNLPTIPDTGPTITITGPVGGDGGILVVNTTVPVTDTTGVRQPQQFTLPFKLPTSADSVTLKFAAQTFTHNGVNFRPTKPNYQQGYFSIKNGVVNVCELSAIGANPVTGGGVKVDWWRKKA